jgi:hypothetical protein
LESVQTSTEFPELPGTAAGAHQLVVDIIGAIFKST